MRNQQRLIAQATNTMKPEDLQSCLKQQQLKINMQDSSQSPGPTVTMRRQNRNQTQLVGSKPLEKFKSEEKAPQVGQHVFKSVDGSRD